MFFSVACYFPWLVAVGVFLLTNGTGALGIIADELSSMAPETRQNYLFYVIISLLNSLYAFLLGRWALPRKGEQLDDEPEPYVPVGTMAFGGLIAYIFFSYFLIVFSQYDYPATSALANLIGPEPSAALAIVPYLALFVYAVSVRELRTNLSKGRGTDKIVLRYMDRR